MSSEVKELSGVGVKFRVDQAILLEREREGCVHAWARERERCGN